MDIKGYKVESYEKYELLLKKFYKRWFMKIVQINLNVYYGLQQI